MANMPPQRIPLDREFFCDGPYYLLTSSSLGGSGLTAEAVSDIVGQGDEQGIAQLLRDGVCMPLFFGGDCALDSCTTVVLGDLTEQEAHDWIGRLAWKLSIPCGQFILHCGGGDPDELAYALSGQPPRPHYQISQAIAVPPGDYLVEIYAYLSSTTVQLSLSEYDEHWNEKDNSALEAWYETNRPGLANQGYVIRLTPLETEPPMPRLVSEIGWCGEFEFRRPEL